MKKRIIIFTIAMYACSSTIQTLAVPWRQETTPGAQALRGVLDACGALVVCASIWTMHRTYKNLTQLPILKKDCEMLDSLIKEEKLTDNNNRKNAINSLTIIKKTTRVSLLEKSSYDDNNIKYMCYIGELENVKKYNEQCQKNIKECILTRYPQYIIPLSVTSLVSALYLTCKNILTK